MNLDILICLLLIWKCVNSEEYRTVCEIGIYQNEACYFPALLKKNFTEAVEFCQQLDGSLVTIKTPAAMKAAKKVLSSVIHSDSWVGLTDFGHEGAWRYLDGSNLSESQIGMLFQSPPTGGAAENCALMQANVGKRIIDYRCEARLPFLCDLKPSVWTVEKICPRAYQRLGDKCFRIVGSKKDYISANNSCTQDGGRLAVVKSRRTHEFLKNFANSHGAEYLELWLGLDDIQKEGEWVYSDGTRVSSQDFHGFWNIGEPNGGRQQNCGALRSAKFDHLIGDLSCDLFLNFVCEKEVFNVEDR